MKKKLLLLVLVLACAWLYRPGVLSRARAQLSRSRAPFKSPVMDVEPPRMREAMLASYRLRPDRRFLDAITELHRLHSDEVSAAVEATFEGRSWKIRYGKSELGSVPELPDFPDLLKVLTDEAGRLAKTHPLRAASAAKPSPDLFLADQAIADLETQEPSSPGVAPGPSAAHDLSLICFQLADAVELADLLPARALANLVIGDAATRRRDEALLANALGYSGHAASLATSLPDGDPLRLFLLLEDEELSRRSRLPGANDEVRYLWLKRVAAQNDLAAWEKERTRLFPGAPTLPILKIGLDLDLPGQMEADEKRFWSADAMPAALLLALGARPDDDVESALQAHCAARRGRLWGAQACDAMFRAPYYSALQQRSSQAPGGTDTAKAYNELLRAQYQGGLAYLRSKQEGPRVGGAALVDLATKTAKALAWDGTEVSEAVRLFASRLDSRLKHRDALARPLNLPLMSYGASERLARSVLAATSNENRRLRGECAVYIGDWKTVGELVHSPRCSAEDAASILQSWWYTHSALDQLEVEFDALIARYPSTWNPTNYFVDVLRAKKSYRKACSILESWLEKNRDPKAVGFFHAHVRQSKSYFLAGEYQKGLDVVSPPDHPFKQRAAARCLNRLGRHDEAEVMARGAFKELSYDPETRSDYAALLWENEKYKEAAEILSEGRLGSDEWYWNVVPDFVEVFADRPFEKAAAAMAALQAQHVDKASLARLADGFAKDGRYETALKLVAQVEPPGAADMDARIITYQYLKGSQGKEAAAQWLKRLIPPESRNPICVKALYTKEFDLLWDFIETPNPSDQGEIVWLIRACAFARRPDTKDPHLAELTRHFGSKSSDPYHQVARYLIGLESEEELFSLATAPNLRATVAFYKANKAQGEGRYEEAVDWYRVVLESGQTGEMGWHLTLRTLSEWAERRQGITGIAAAKL